MRQAQPDRAFDKDTVPTPRRKHFVILSPKPGKECKAQITSDRPVAAWTHFSDKTSYPCGRSAHDCPFCFHNIPPRWKCYLAGVSIVTGKAVLIEVTQGAAHESPSLRSPDVSLRGKVITLYRTGQAVNSPVHARIEEPSPTLSRAVLPQPFDVRSALAKMWGNPWSVKIAGFSSGDDETPEDQLIPC